MWTGSQWSEKDLLACLREHNNNNTKTPALYKIHNPTQIFKKDPDIWS